MIKPYHLKSRFSVVMFTLFNSVLLLLIFAQFADFDNRVQGGGDHWEYQSIAVNMVSGKGFMVQGGVLPFENYLFREHNPEPWPISEQEFESAAGRNFYRSPIYPLFISSVYYLFGINPSTLKYIQLGLMCLGACLIIPIGFLLLGRAGMLCGLVSSWLFMLSFYDISGKLYAESLLTFIAAAVLASWVIFLKRPRFATSILLGFFMGVAILSKGTFYFSALATLLVLGIWFLKRKDLKMLTLFGSVVGSILLVVLPYVAWQNLVAKADQETIFICQQGELALLGGNNEFAEDGNWTYLSHEKPGFYSTLPQKTHALKKVALYYSAFPNKAFSALFKKLRNAVLRPPAASLLAHASILALLFWLFKSFFVRSILFLGSTTVFAFNALSSGFLHYRFIDQSPAYYIPILVLTLTGLVYLSATCSMSKVNEALFPFVFSLLSVAVIFYGHERIVMPFYIGTIFLGSAIWFKVAYQLCNTRSFKAFQTMLIKAPSKTKLHYLIMIMLPCIIPLALLESYLRFDGGYDTYGEKNGDGYRSYYNQEPCGSIYWNYPISTTFTTDPKEFEYTFITNELGLREKPTADFLKEESAFRILTLGDSFTEGHGAPYDSAWPRVLESEADRLKAILEGKPVQVYNAGMAGSDPYFNYVMLRDKLLVLKPNLVIQCINTSDLTDYFFRGGMERFKDGKVYFRKGPWWEIIYRFSYTFRLVMHTVFRYDHMLVAETGKPKYFDHAVRDYADVFANNFRQLAEENSFDLVFVVIPMPSDLRWYGENYQKLEALHDILKENNLTSLNLLRPMINTIGNDPNYEYCWKVDGHFNGKGYWELGKLITDSIECVLTQRATLQVQPAFPSSTP